MVKIAQLHCKRLNDSINCTEFDCGVEPLNRFLAVRALTEMSQRLSVTTATSNGEGAVAGFYSISPTQIGKEFLSKNIGRGVPYETVPGMRIGRLAVHKDHQGNGTGAMLLRHALQKCLKMSEEFGGRVVVVDAKNDTAAAFYSRYGFKPIKDDPLVLVLKVSTLAKIETHSNS